MSKLPIPRREDLFFPIEQHFNKFFDDFFRDQPHSFTSNSGFPKLNAYEKDDKFVLTVAVAGMSSEDLIVEVLPDNCLLIKGKMTRHQVPTGSKVYLQELRGSAFERLVKLPEIIEGDPEAFLKDGILILTFNLKNKFVEESKNKIVKINSG